MSMTTYPYPTSCTLSQLEYADCQSRDNRYLSFRGPVHNRAFNTECYNSELLCLSGLLQTQYTGSFHRHGEASRESMGWLVPQDWPAVATAILLWFWLVFLGGISARGVTSTRASIVECIFNWMTGFPEVGSWQGSLKVGQDRARR